MNRRTLLLGVTAGASGLAGTGAFTSASADRSAVVTVADDDEGVLAMEPSPGPNGEFATLDGGQLALSFGTTDAGGGGTNSGTELDVDNVFHLTNLGTQPLYLWADFDGPTLDDSDLWLYPGSSPETPLNDGPNDVLTLPVGETVSIGVHVDTTALDPGDEATPTMTIFADVDVPEGSTPRDPFGDDAAVVTKTPDGGEYETIQDGIDAVSGSTVYVGGGTYAEAPTIDVPGLTLRPLGDARPTIDAGGADAALNVAVDGVTIEGVEIRNDDGRVGIDIGTDIDGTTVRDVTIRNLGPTGTSTVAGVAVGPGDHDGLAVVDCVVEDLEQSAPDGDGPAVAGILVDAAGEGTLSNATITGTEIRGLESDRAALGVALRPALDGVTVADNEVADLVAATDRGPYDGTTVARGLSVGREDEATTTAGVELRHNEIAAIDSADGYYAEAVWIAPGVDVAGLDVRKNALLAPIGLNNGDSANDIVSAERNFWDSPDGPIGITANDDDGDIPVPGGDERTLEPDDPAAVTMNADHRPYSEVRTTDR